MNKKLSIAIGAAAAVAAMGGAAVAADLNTINQSENYADPGNAAGFLPAFAAECGAAAGGSSVATGTVGMMTAMMGTAPACAGHGNHAMNAAANGNFFNVVEFVPQFSSSENSGYSVLVDPGFDNGLFDVTSGSYFLGLNLGWTSIAGANAAMGGTPDIPQGVGTAGTSTIETRAEWVDQVVVGYVTSTDVDGVLGTELKQNFRSELSWQGGATNVALAKAVVDQRLEQQVELSTDLGIPLPFEASRQTFRQAISTINDAFGTGGTTDPDVAYGHENGIAQLVSQDVEGYLFSCLNCDTPGLLATAGGSHAWTPTNTADYSFVPYWSNWHSVPTITHAP